ncbi:lipopolysaccharide assembly protein LapA domain-containing protein [Fulvimarina sp. 2208YS6-2-32]|uniref:Lipopolysaccharide assembly protein LapA domain-containing protein n=1 Tax=Fulvimarina uroteuthidis TaxID=3098149 RepID=A0ABU5HYA8_9HYPH|nr:lipopolysaccharide assembly protein LapA domain-containing protein [Fulvimarina sp. 2208YS6-2-32]MDY8108119.1 lipopolysaccharide assembly protein LapA domain-containing protein [Fulvimarina sp. 2208YS6-2-32]
MISRVFTIIVLLLVAIPVVTFLVINRAPVDLSLDPFGTMPQFTYSLPLSLIIIVAALVGVVAGCVFTWISEGSYRRDSWRRKFEMEKMEKEKQEQAEALQRLRQERVERANAERESRPQQASIAGAPTSSARMISSDRAA